MIWKSILLITFIYSVVFAEYRVFELQIYKETTPAVAEQSGTLSADQATAAPETVQANVATPADTQRAPQSEAQIEHIKTVISNLDPQQYTGYYPLEMGEKIKYTATWMCKGRTNGKEYCQNPRLKTEAEPQGSLNGK